MSGNVWVVAEHWRGEVSDVTYELLALGRELAEGLGVSLEAILVGDVSLAETLGAADGVIHVDLAGEATGEQLSRVIGELAKDRTPAAILLAITNAAWELIGLLPVRAGGTLVNFCRELSVVDGRLQAESVLYGGKMIATVASEAAPAIVALLPGTRPADAGRTPGPPPVETIVITAPEARLRFVEFVEPESGGVDITKEDVLIAVGRGLQNEANLDLAEELAEALGGAVCGSRPAIDQGWLPMSAQVGKSGHKVKPKLYVALGISGAPEHLEGMRDAELIIAINTDPDAPIFGVSHYGVTEDLLDVVPELIDRLHEAGRG